MGKPWPPQGPVDPSGGEGPPGKKPGPPTCGQAAQGRSPSLSLHAKEPLPPPAAEIGRRRFLERPNSTSNPSSPPWSPGRSHNSQDVWRGGKFPGGSWDVEEALHGTRALGPSGEKDNISLPGCQAELRAFRPCGAGRGEEMGTPPSENARLRGIETFAAPPRSPRAALPDPRRPSEAGPRSARSAAGGPHRLRISPLTR